MIIQTPQQFDDDNACGLHKNSCYYALGWIETWFSLKKNNKKVRYNFNQVSMLNTQFWLRYKNIFSKICLSVPCEFFS